MEGGTSDKDIYDNLIFVMSPATAEIIAEKIREPTKELEQKLWIWGGNKMTAYMRLR